MTQRLTAASDLDPRELERELRTIRKIRQATPSTFSAAGIALLKFQAERFEEIRRSPLASALPRVWHRLPPVKGLGRAWILIDSAGRPFSYPVQVDRSLWPLLTRAQSEMVFKITRLLRDDGGREDKLWYCEGEGTGRSQASDHLQAQIQETWEILTWAADPLADWRTPEVKRQQAARWP